MFYPSNTKWSGCGSVSLKQPMENFLFQRAKSLRWPKWSSHSNSFSIFISNGKKCKFNENYLWERLGHTAHKGYGKEKFSLTYHLFLKWVQVYIIYHNIAVCHNKIKQSKQSRRFPSSLVNMDLSIVPGEVDRFKKNWHGYHRGQMSRMQPPSSHETTFVASLWHLGECPSEMSSHLHHVRVDVLC